MEQPTADEEIQVISSMKEKLDKFWNDHIDVDDNGDCDIDEWVTRLQDLEVDLSEDEMRMFFNRVDDGQAQFLDRNEFIQFMNHQFTNDELIKYQNAIFDKIDDAKNSDENNIDGNIVSENDESEMDEIAIYLMKQNLKRELKQTGHRHYKMLSAAENILAQIKNEEEEHPTNFNEV